ncbi:MAG: cyclic nucleotide-binding domain-containing protein, partial [Bacteroidales bacterium]|nr:cyclic nucleotide-binding domain-containing protein [Bacteroidales bacterium]
MKTETSFKELLFNAADSLFFKLSKEDKELLLKNTECRTYKKGELVFLENTKPSGLICLVEGKVKIFKEGAGGRDQIIRLSRPGGFIGYRALFASENYHASAVAIENSV